MTQPTSKLSYPKVVTWTSSREDILSPKNKYLEEVVNIPVIGIPPKAFEIPKSSEDNSSKLMNMINNTEMF
eukprot:scaffold28836_cov67-Attheya_sp.AAC.2